MARTIAKSATSSKPSDSFTKHTRGWWIKKVRGKTRYFTKVSEDPRANRAAELWAEWKDDLLAGRTPRAKLAGLTVKALCNHFLDAKESLQKKGDLKPRTYREYKSTGARLQATFGEQRPVSDLQQEDFSKLLDAMPWGPVRRANEIQRVRSIFKFAFEAELIDKPIKFGPTFKKPSRPALRRHKKSKAAKHGKRLFTPDEIRKLLATASTQFRAMVLLGINCAFGNGDCAMLPIRTIDFDGGWLEFPRPKTGTDRRCKLWPETLAALKVALAKRPEPKNPDHAGLVFITKYGRPWVNQETGDNAIAKRMAWLLTKLKIRRPNLNFYALRHTACTVGREVDRGAAKFIMGHAESADDMGAVYDEERPSDKRLKRVADELHSWLFGSKGCDFSAGRL